VAASRCRSAEIDLRIVPPLRRRLTVGGRSIYKPAMTAATKRSILRWIHIVLAIPIAGYVYSPFHNLPDYAVPTRFVFFPGIALTGLWMWQGPAIRRLFSRRSQAASD